MGFSNIRGMLEQLANETFEEGHTAKFVTDCMTQSFPLSEGQQSEIVRLYNIHCVPKRWENSRDAQEVISERQANRKRKK